MPCHRNRMLRNLSKCSHNEGAFLKVQKMLRSVAISLFSKVTISSSLIKSQSRSYLPSCVRLMGGASLNKLMTSLREKLLPKNWHTKKGRHIRAPFFVAILKVAKTTLLAMPINMNNEGCPKSWTEGSSTFEVAMYIRTGGDKCTFFRLPFCPSVRVETSGFATNVFGL